MLYITKPQGKRFRIVGIVLVLLSLTAVVSAKQGATSHQLPLHAIRSGDCTGELVELTGIIHLVSHTQQDGSVIGHFNYQNVTGIGLTSGIRYHVSAVDHFHLSASIQSSVHSVRNFHLISEGSSDNLLVQGLYIINVNANGEVTVEVDDLSMVCA